MSGEERGLIPASSASAGFAAAVVLSVLGVSLNSFTLATLLTSPKLLKHSTTHFVVSLTVADLLYCGFSLPMTADTFAGCGICRVDVLCRLYAFSFYWNVSAMLLGQAAVAFNRFVIVCCPVKPVIKVSHSPRPEANHSLKK